MLIKCPTNPFLYTSQQLGVIKISQQRKQLKKTEVSISRENSVKSLAIWAIVVLWILQLFLMDSPSLATFAKFCEKIKIHSFPKPTEHVQLKITNSCNKCLADKITHWIWKQFCIREKNPKQIFKRMKHFFLMILSKNKSDNYINRLANLLVFVYYYTSL